MSEEPAREKCREKCQAIRAPSFAAPSFGGEVRPDPYAGTGGREDVPESPRAA